MPDDVGVRNAQDFCNTPVHRPKRAIQGDRERHIFQRVNQFLEVALRARNHLRKLIQLVVRGHDPGAVLQVLQQMLQFPDFAPPSEGIDRKQHRQNQEADWDGPQSIGQVLELFPGKDGDGQRHQDKKPERPPPQLALLPLQMAGRKIRPVRNISLLGHSRYLASAQTLSGNRAAFCQL